MKIGVSSYSFQQLINSGEESQLSIMKKAKEMGFDGPGYYWKDSTRSMKAFLELFGAKDKSLPKQVTDFQAQFEKFVEEFDTIFSI